MRDAPRSRMCPNTWVRIRRWWCCTSPTGRRLDRSSDLGSRMTAGSCSSHPRRLIASVSRSDPSRDTRFLASSGGLSTPRALLAVRPKVAVGDHARGFLNTRPRRGRRTTKPNRSVGRERGSPDGRYVSSAPRRMGGPMTKPSLSAVRDLTSSKTSPCSRCQHAEFVHAYAGPCLFHDCECPFFTADPDVEED